MLTRQLLLTLIKKVRGRFRAWIGTIAGTCLLSLPIFSAGLCLAVSSARAQSVADPWEKPFAVEGQVGVGTPLGFVGAQAEYAPFPWLGLSGGIGLSDDGLQIAMMPRLRVPLGSVALALGLGMSAGAEEQRACEGPGGLCLDMDYEGPEYDRTWNLGVFGNAEVAMEVRARSGFVFRTSLGMALLLNAGDYDCRGPDADTCIKDDSDVAVWFPYLGVSFGYAFGP